MPEEDYDDWMCRGLPELGDVVVTTEAPLEEVAEVRDTRVAFAQRIILFKVNRREWKLGIILTTICFSW